MLHELAIMEHRRTLGAVLEERSREVPHRPFLRFGRDELTFAQTNAASDRLAVGLAGLGVGAGEPAIMMLPNRDDYVISWFALAKLGAPAMGLDPAMSVDRLAGMLRLTGARVLIADARSLARIESAAAGTAVETIVICDGFEDLAGRADSRFAIRSLEELESFAGERPRATIGGSDLAMLLTTSGSTGTPKACELPHRTALRIAETHVEALSLRSTDVLFCPFPLFHIDASLLTVVPALLLGACAAIGSGFDAEAFWEEAEEAGATIIDLLGDSLASLSRLPPLASDSTNGVRLAWGAYLADPALADEFERRFDLRMAGGMYGLTDVAIVAYQPLDEPQRAGSAGKPVRSFDLRIFDEFDEEVPSGEVGEVVVRPTEPWAMSTGYYSMPEATLEGSRNLWRHTGDLGHLDADGYLYIRGRKAHETGRESGSASLLAIEDTVGAHPEVVEAAAFRVGEDADAEVKVCVVPVAGSALDPTVIWAFCEEKLAADGIPRYLELLPALPKTPTRKVEKYELQRDWLTPGTVDRRSRRIRDFSRDAHPQSEEIG
ncbi:MAG: AMP-binding protein [Solirubrobacterales bacterium]